MSAVNPKIETKFTMAGVKVAVADLRRFGTETRTTFSGIKKSVSDAFKPAEADIKRLHRSMTLLRTSAVGGVTLGFKGLEKTASASLRAIKISAVAATAAVAGIGLAAVKSAKDSAAELAKIDNDSKRYGVSAEDLSVLEFAGKREGLDSDAVNMGIVKMGQAMKDLRDKTASANKEFDRLRDNARGDALIALFRQDKDAFASAGDAVKKARPNSQKGIEGGIAIVEAQLAKTDIIKSGESKQMSRLRAIRVFELNKQLHELQQAQKDYVDSLGAEGKALHELEQRGLNVDGVMKGGVEGFIALGDAIRTVEDPAQRLSYSIAFFGEKAGPKMLPLLMKGRKGIEDYRKELERLGGVVTAADAQKGADYEDSVDALKRSVGGVKLAIARELLGPMTDLNKRGTEMLVRYRKNIADFVKAGFDGARDLGADAIAAYNGKRSGFRTEWLDTAFDKIRELKQAVKDFRVEVSKAFDKGDSKYEWLNAVVAGFKTAKAFAEDIMAVFRGKDAKNFPWVNELRDWLKSFFADLQIAFGLFRDTLKFIGDYIIGPIAKLLNTDIVATSLFVGMLRFSGILELVLTTLGGIAKIGKSAFVVTAAAAGVRATAPAAAAAAGALAGPATKAVAGGAELAKVTAVSTGALAGIRATTTAALAAVSRIGAAMITAMNGIAVLAAAAYAGWKAGEFLAQKATDWSGLTANRQKTLDMTAELVRMQGDQSFAKSYKTWDLDRKKSYWTNSRGISYDDGRQSRMLSNGQMDVWGNGRGGMDLGITARPKETIEVKLDFNGVPTTGVFPALDARRIGQEANRLSRMGG